MNDEQEYHHDSDLDCLHNIAHMLTQLGEMIKEDPELSRKLYPIALPTWCRIEAERLREIADRWVR